MTEYSREPWLGRDLGRAAVAPWLRMLEQKAGRDSAAARELARVPATSLWTPELEALPLQTAARRGHAGRRHGQAARRGQGRQAEGKRGAG